MSAGLVVVGGSYAALQIAASARQAGYAGPIRILAEEAALPYQRPPLSKAYLAGEAGEDKLPLRAEAFYREQSIAVSLGTRVTAIDRAKKRVRVGSGEELAWERLALATGARPRTLGIPGALVLRSLADANALKARLAGAQSVAIVGGGFIGLEVAAVCAKLGKRVTVLEAQPRLLARVFPPLMSAFMAEAHRRHGVEVRTGVDAKAELAALGADLVLEAVGVVPNEELAAACGLACDNGVLVDRQARTSDPDIVAAGDCTRHPSSYAEAPVRLESVQNAMDQSRVAGATLAGKDAVYDAVPWFWSDQYDLRLQMTGLAAGHDAHAVRGSMDAGKFSVFYLRAGRIVAADSVNDSATHMLARKLVAARAECDAVRIADLAFDLKALLAG